MTLSKAEGDIFANKTNILLAKSQRQIASWLPPRTARDEPSIHPEEIEDEEGDFSVEPEVLGLGGTIPKDGEVKTAIASNDKLRKQLLGRDYAKKHTDRKGREEQGKPKSGPLYVGSKPYAVQGEDDDSEDNEGRSSLGKSKKHRVNTVEEAVDTGVASLMRSETAMLDQPENPPRPSKRANNYLDEVLADRSRKKQKSKRKKKKATAESNSDV